MRILGKHISASVSLAKPDGDVLTGIQLCSGVSECCGTPVVVTRIGFGFGEVDIFVQEGHNHGKE